ncbi:MAG: hypothetical protein WA893_19720 [Xanthobacteraceae bacterium]
MLLGSVGLHSAEDVFRTVSAKLGDRIKRIPDGETGPRSLWVFWPRRVLERNAAVEIDPEEGARGMRATSEVEGVRREFHQAGSRALSQRRAGVKTSNQVKR